MQKALQKTRDMLKKYGTDAMSKVLPYYEVSEIKSKKMQQREYGKLYRLSLTRLEYEKYMKGLVYRIISK